MPLDQLTALAAQNRAILNFAPDYIPFGGNSFWGQTLAPLVYSNHLFFRYFEDFARGFSPVATTLQPAGWKYLADGNGNVTSIDGRGGQIQLATTATLNDETYLSVDGLTTGANDFFDITANSGRRLWYETRIRPLQSGNNFSLFAGLFTDSAVAANAIFDTTGAIVDTNFVGFQIDPAAGNSWIYTHKKSGQTVQKVSAIATNDGATNIRLSFYFDGATTLRFWVNDVLASNIIDVSASTFPTGSALVPAFLMKSTSAAAKQVVIDYIDVIQGR